MQSSLKKSFEVDSPFSQTSRPSNRFEVIGSNDMEAEDTLESPAITEDTASDLQPPLPSSNKATDEQTYIEDDPLAEIVEIFMVVLVSEELSTNFPRRRC